MSMALQRVPQLALWVPLRQKTLMAAHVGMRITYNGMDMSNTSQRITVIKRFSSVHPTASDNLPNRIISGKVLVKPNIKEFATTSAIFKDGTREENLDVVIFATGYSFSFPFLGDCVKVVENQVSLYKFVFPPHLEKPTLAFIGLIQPFGPLMPIAELRGHWATRVFKGLNGLPSASDMVADIAQKREEMAKQYVKSQRHTIQADYIPYMDELACLTGMKPSLLSLFLMDPKLAVEVFFGPCTPYQYRLRGPRKWDRARKSHPDPERTDH